MNTVTISTFILNSFAIALELLACLFFVYSMLICIHHAFYLYSPMRYILRDIEEIICLSKVTPLSPIDIILT